MLVTPACAAADRRGLAEVRCDGHAAGAGLLHDRVDQPDVKPRVDLDHTGAGGDLLAHRDRAHRPSVLTIAGVLPEAAGPVEQRAGCDDPRAIGRVLARERENVVGPVVQVAHGCHAVPQEERQRPAGDVHVRVDETGDERAAGSIHVAARARMAPAPTLAIAAMRPRLTLTFARAVTRPSPWTTRTFRITMSAGSGAALVMTHAVAVTSRALSTIDGVILPLPR